MDMALERKAASSQKFGKTDIAMPMMAAVVEVLLIMATP